MEKGTHLWKHLCLALFIALFTHTFEKCQYHSYFDEEITRRIRVEDSHQFIYYLHTFTARVTFSKTGSTNTERNNLFCNTHFK